MAKRARANFTAGFNPAQKEARVKEISDQKNNEPN